ncbi:unnamed protein product, partial [Heterotrigona itama]
KEEEEEEMKEKGKNASGDRFLLGARPRMIKSLSMVGGVIKDPRLSPYENLKWEERRRERKQFDTSFAIAYRIFRKYLERGKAQ